ncbi:MAG: P-loop NTPase fold protein [Candidatus Shapirobacteria bacterium]|jgi:hypothetical protein
MKKNRFEVENFKFKFLPDTPLSSTKDTVMFGHEQVAKALLNIVVGSTPPFTIGLYGGWGSGKSTVINLLAEELDNINVKHVVFDVWKYSEDSLRRQFLIESARQLGQTSKVKKLTEKFVYSLTKKIETIRFTPKKFIVSIIPIVLFSLVWSWVTGDINQWKSITILCLGGAFIFQKYQDKLLIVDDNVLTRDKISQPEEFENEFKEIVNDSNENKLLFIFDNLDRAPRQKVVELLTTIKTFLEIRKCIFLVPCDETAVRKHISSALLSNDSKKISDQDKQDYADEFLRKFFNTVVRMPKVEYLDLDVYTTSLLNDTQIELFNKNPDLLELITYSFKNNPREIKQFINSLISLIIIVYERFDEKITKKLSKNDIAFFAKVLILKQKYHDIYTKLEESILNDAMDWTEAEKGVLRGTLEESMKFLKNTYYITPDTLNVGSYITLKQSKEEISLPGWEQFIQACLSRDVESASKFVNSFIKQDKISIFENFLLYYLKSNSQRQALIRPISSTCVKVFSDILNTSIPPKVARELARQISGPLLRPDTYEDYPIQNTIKVVKSGINKTQNKELSQAYIGLFNHADNNSRLILKEDYALSILNHVSTDIEYFQSSIRNVKDLLKDRLNSRKYIEVFIDKDNLEKFISNETITNYITRNFDAGTLNDDDELRKNLGLLNTIGELDEGQIRLIVEKVKELIAAESNNPPDRNQRDVLIEFLTGFIEKFLDTISTAEVEYVSSNIGVISTSATAWYNNSSWSIKTKVFLLSLILRKIDKNDKNTTLESSIIKPFIQNAPYDEAFSTLDEKVVEEIISKNYPEYIKGCMRSYDFFTKGFKYLSSDQRGQIALSMMSSSLEFSVNAIKKSNYLIGASTVSVLNELFNRLDSQDENFKANVFEIAYKTHCGKDPAVEERFFNELKNVKGSDFGDRMIKKYVKKQGRLFSKSQKSDLLNVTPIPAAS